jgi:hypothetical protein
VLRISGIEMGVRTILCALFIGYSTSTDQFRSLSNSGLRPLRRDIVLVTGFTNWPKVAVPNGVRQPA